MMVESTCVGVTMRLVFAEEAQLSRTRLALGC